METELLRLLTDHLPSMLPGIGVAILLGYAGRYAVPMVKDLPEATWRTWYLRTTWAHPVVAGALFGLAPDLPVPAFMSDGWTGSILWYALAGVVSLPVYRRLMRRVEGKGEGR